MKHRSSKQSRQRRSSGRGGNVSLRPRSLEQSAADCRGIVTVSGGIRHPLVYRKRLAGVDGNPAAGDLVEIRDEAGVTMGFGLYNPKSELALRVLSEETSFAPDFWRRKLARAVQLRTELLKVERESDACRLIHAEADGFSGLVVDRYGDILSAEAFTPGMWQRAAALLEELHAICGTRHGIVQCAPQTLSQEGFSALPVTSPDCPPSTVIQEFGTRFRIEFGEGHKTGFFCDQRENRRLLAGFTPGKRVLDICCYTGGFAVQAAALGEATEVIGLDLDENAIALARKNAQLNGARIKFTQVDAFAWMRDAIAAGQQFGVVVLDPPKLIHNRQELDEGKRAHFDLNRLAMQLVEPGGILLTCTCSGLLSGEEFKQLVCSAARQAGEPLASDPTERFSRRGPREMQIFLQTGAASDHPVGSNCPQTEYLNALWCRLV